MVDEEQRFGVSHKESIKAMTDGVDVLTLTASPIPRTLEMALTGIRDLSMVNTPPAARRPILTHVGEFEEAAASEAIRRELLREGQVFYVHNRVQDIDAVAERVRAHGPRGPGGGGPRPDGRGHAGEGGARLLGGRATTCWCAPPSSSRGSTCRRSTPWWSTGPTCWAWASSTSCGAGWAGPGQRAYAYLFHPVDRVLSEQAYERLRTIGDHTELGSGFKIALRDLQIRGAGNLLGPGPVGPHRRHRLRPLRADGVRGGLRAEGRAAGPSRSSSSSTCPTPPTCPPTYVAAEDVRLEAYRRLAAVRTEEQVDDVRTEWEDRFGPLPGAGRGPAGRGPAAGRVPAPRDHRRGGHRRPGPGMGRSADQRASVKLSPHHPGRLGRGPAAAAGPRRHLPGRPAPAAAAGRPRRPRGSGTPPALVELLPELVPPAVRARRRREHGRRVRPADSIAAVKRQLSGAVAALVVIAAGALASACHVTPTGGHRPTGSTISAGTLNTELHTLETTVAGAACSSWRTPS